jgi:hypothetical protein
VDVDIKGGVLGLGVLKRHVTLETTSHFPHMRLFRTKSETICKLRPKAFVFVQAEEEVPDLLELWEESGCTKVCLKVNSEVPKTKGLNPKS